MRIWPAAVRAVSSVSATTAATNCPRWCTSLDLENQERPITDRPQVWRVRRPEHRQYAGACPSLSGIHRADACPWQRSMRPARRTRPRRPRSRRRTLPGRSPCPDLPPAERPTRPRRRKWSRSSRLSGQLSERADGQTADQPDLECVVAQRTSAGQLPIHSLPEAIRRGRRRWPHAPSAALARQGTWATPPKARRTSRTVPFSTAMAAATDATANEKEARSETLR